MRANSCGGKMNFIVTMTGVGNQGAMFQWSLVTGAILPDGLKYP